MSISDIRLELHQIIDGEDDIQKLAAIYTLLRKSDKPHVRMSVDEYISQIDESRNQIKKGKFQTQEQLEKEVKTW
ncbi:MAG: hypothetical protein ABJG78_04120 [Cyclobacteriaceae bacterium]